jgi:hypothetical protein
MQMPKRGESFELKLSPLFIFQPGNTATTPRL